MPVISSIIARQSKFTTDLIRPGTFPCDPWNIRKTALAGTRPFGTKYPEAAIQP
jgi:hypothetical protein